MLSSKTEIMFELVNYQLEKSVEKTNIEVADVNSKTMKIYQDQ